MAQVFHLPLAEVINPARMRLHTLRRGGKVTPYWALAVSDLLSPAHIEQGDSVAWDGSTLGIGWASDSYRRHKIEIGGGKEGELEVWGLTGWYLNVLCRALGIYRR